MGHPRKGILYGVYCTVLVCVHLNVYTHPSVHTHTHTLQTHAHRQTHMGTDNSLLGCQGTVEDLWVEKERDRGAGREVFFKNLGVGRTCMCVCWRGPHCSHRPGTRH